MQVMQLVCLASQAPSANASVNSWPCQQTRANADRASSQRHHNTLGRAGHAAAHTHRILGGRRAGHIDDAHLEAAQAPALTVCEGHVDRGDARAVGRGADDRGAIPPLQLLIAAHMVPAALVQLSNLADARLCFTA